MKSPQITYNVNWDLVAKEPTLVRGLSERLFDVGKVPTEVRTEYYRQFEIYKETQEIRRLDQEYISAKSTWDAKYGPQIVPYKAPLPE